MGTGLTFVNQVGAVEGMNQAAPGTLIPESFVRFSQDVLFDRAGLVRRRGPFSTSLDTIYNPVTVAQNESVLSVTSCLNPINERIICAIINNSTGASVNGTKFYFYKSNGSTYSKQVGISDLGYAFDNTSTIDSKAALGGGAWIGIVEKYGVSTTNANERQALYYWRGGYGVEANKTGAVISTSDTTITGLNNTTNITSGMFVYVDTNKYIGVVKTVNNTSIVLEKIPFRVKTFGATETLTFKNVRPYMHRHGRGLITKTDGDGSGQNDVISGDIGTSGEGHFAAANINGYNLYRASDNAWIGLVNNIYKTDATKSNKVLQLDNTHGAFTMNGDEYIAVYHNGEASPIAAQRTSFSSDSNNTAFTGVFNATYAGLQWFGCMGITGQTNRIVFSAPHDPEAVDLSKDSADSIIIPGIQQMRGIASSNSGLVVLMEDKVYLIRGNDRANFSLELLFPEGCICNSSIIETGGGVIWASRAGILYYDGATVRNLTSDNLGVYYSDGVTNFNPNSDICAGFIYRDYVFFHFTKWSSKYSMTRYEPIYSNKWASVSTINDNNTIVDAASSAADGLAGVSWRDFNDDNISWYNLSTASNTPIGWDYVDEQLNSITFAIYLPTNAITTISNFPFRGAAFDDGVLGLKALVGVTQAASSPNGNRIDLYNIDTMLDITTDGEDHALSIGSVRKGPDLYMQTKHYSVGDPILKKWFQKMMINLMLERGAVRVDFIDAEDNDAFDVYNLKHKNWEVFTEKGLSWDYAENTLFPKLTSPSYASWAALASENYTWLTLLFADYGRQAKRFSLRQSSIGFRLYQLNNFRDPYQTAATRPRKIQAESWNIGYKPLRGGRL